MRKILNTKKIGHTGTLDPQATGVLPICIGKGTKVSDMLTNSDKEYIARVRLGETYDTEDVWGELISKTPCTHITKEQITDAANSFIGEIDQVPPMYSAVKINGKKLYEYARSGVEIERKSRKVTIRKISVEDFCDNEFTMRVSCSKGTYIRTLCSDIGKKLGVGAAMCALERTRSSVFTVEDALTLDRIKEYVQEGKALSITTPVDKLFEDYDKVSLNSRDTAGILNGMFLKVSLPDGKYRVYSDKNEFLCIAQATDNVLKTVKNFYAG